MAFEQRSLDEYIDVAQRIADFRAMYPEGSLRPWNPEEPYRLLQAQGFDKGGEVVQQTFLVVVAAAYRHGLDDNPGIGMAWEIFPGRTPYTRGSELQNAETSAWGRAIIAVGASDSKKGIASREEVRNRQAERDDSALPNCPKCNHLKAWHRPDVVPPGCDSCDCTMAWNRDGSLSRSRTSDEEKAAAGVETDAERKAHTDLAKPPANTQAVNRLSTTPGDDPWTDGPAGLMPQDDPEDRPGSATTEQIRDIQALYAAGFKITDRQAKLETTRKFLQLDMLPSHTRLSYRQAGDLLLAMRHKLSEKAAK